MRRAREAPRSRRNAATLTVIPPARVSPRGRYLRQDGRIAAAAGARRAPARVCGGVTPSILPVSRALESRGTTAARSSTRTAHVPRAGWLPPRGRSADAVETRMRGGLSPRDSMSGGAESPKDLHSLALATTRSHGCPARADSAAFREAVHWDSRAYPARSSSLWARRAPSSVSKIRSVRRSLLSWGFSGFMTCRASKKRGPTCPLKS